MLYWRRKGVFGVRVAVITTKESDLSALLRQYAQVDIFPFESVPSLDAYDSIALLGGTSAASVAMPIDLRLQVERAMQNGKPVFAEWLSSIGYCYPVSSKGTVSDRMLWLDEQTDGLRRGDLLDDRANSRMIFGGFPKNAQPLLACGGHIVKHDHTDDIPDVKPEDWTLWMYEDTTMVCTFRLCNFAAARFAPAARWNAIASHIIRHLTGKTVQVCPAPVVTMDNPAAPLADTFKRGVAWMDAANLLIDEGKSGAYEGLAHNINPEGVQSFAPAVRNDCSGEVGGAYFFDWLLHKNEQSYARFQNLQTFSFERMTDLAEGPLYGMMRWTTNNYGVCYGDDVARTVLGSLLSMQFTEEKRYLDTIRSAMDFLLSTTGTDGLRVSRTDAETLTDEKLQALRETPSDFPCAHHNGYYMATLLLTYRQTGETKYLTAAEKGLRSMMAVFPDTIREHSETQELCRLILPLACLYEATGSDEHKGWLYAVADRLETYRHENGGYTEYDTGYKANRSRTSGTESSLLADNGDPVADLLYSLNWLPLGFAYAYQATADERFKRCWQDITAFMTNVQMRSDNPKLDGCWCRGIDLDRREAYGMPHDVGWGACAVESGWTVAEILMGIGFGLALKLDA